MKAHPIQLPTPEKKERGKPEAHSDRQTARASDKSRIRPLSFVWEQPATRQCLNGSSTRVTPKRHQDEMGGKGEEIYREMEVDYILDFF